MIRPLRSAVLLGCGGPIIGLIVGSCGSAPPDPVVMPEELVAFQETILASAAQFGESQGAWLDDYGDAPFYGLALYTRLDEMDSNPAYEQLVERARNYNTSVLMQAESDLDWLVANMEEVMMATLGLIEYIAVTGDTSPLAAVDGFLDTASSFVQLFGDYIPASASIGSFALNTYGPTSITGGLALLHLQYATYLETPSRAMRLERAIQIVSAIVSVHPRFFLSRRDRRAAPIMI